MGAEDFDKMQAYKIANGQVNANPLVDKDGMINLAMDYESEQESEGIVQKSIGHFMDYDLWLKVYVPAESVRSFAKSIRSFAVNKRSFILEYDTQIFRCCIQESKLYDISMIVYYRLYDRRFSLMIE